MAKMIRKMTKGRQPYIYELATMVTKVIAAPLGSALLNPT